MNTLHGEYLARLGLLDPEQRLHFFEVLAHNLTVATRGVWSDAELSCEEQVDSMKKLNECLHRVTARVRVQRLNTHVWTDEDFLGLLSATDESLHPRLRGCVAWAVERSYTSASAQP